MKVGARLEWDRVREERLDPRALGRPRRFGLVPGVHPQEVAQVRVDGDEVEPQKVGVAAHCRVALPEEAREQMRGGKKLSLLYTNKDTKGQPRTVRVDQLLHGFRDAYDAMALAIQG